MDLGDLKYLDAPAKVLKLSEAIREFGYRGFNDPAQCVLGRAITGLTGTEYLDWQRPDGESYQQMAARIFNVPIWICKKAENKCLNHEPSADIASWVQAQGY